VNIRFQPEYTVFFNIAERFGCFFALSRINASVSDRLGQALRYPGDGFSVNVLPAINGEIGAKGREKDIVILPVFRGPIIYVLTDIYSQMFFRFGADRFVFRRIIAFPSLIGL
jgi:hypothetical protein